MSDVKIKVGMKFGHLEVIEPREQGKTRQSWLCRCDCGEYIVKPRTHLVGTKTRRPDKSCGCSEYAHNGRIKENKRVYYLWHLMNSRCHDTKADNYERYGGKGVYVVEEWRNDFVSFADWAKNNGYEDGLTLDRIDPKKPYSPDNCRWVDYFTQEQNRGVFRNNKSGVTGVVKYKYGFRTYINRDGIHLNIGTFKTLEEAKQARKKAEDYYLEHGTIKNFVLDK